MNNINPVEGDKSEFLIPDQSDRFWSTNKVFYPFFEWFRENHNNDASQILGSIDAVALRLEMDDRYTVILDKPEGYHSNIYFLVSTVN